MSLRARFAFSLAVLAALTAAAISLAGFRVTASRLNDEIKAADGKKARAPKPSPDRVPSGITIQCLDAGGEVFFTGAGGLLPVDAADVRVAVCWMRSLRTPLRAFAPTCRC